MVSTEEEIKEKTRIKRVRKKLSLCFSAYVKDTYKREKKGKYMVTIKSMKKQVLKETGNYQMFKKRVTSFSES